MDEQQHAQNLAKAVEKYKLTEDEAKMLGELKDMLAKENLAHRYSFTVLARFLAGRKWNLDKAVETIKLFDEIEQKYGLFGPDLSPLHPEVMKEKLAFSRATENSPAVLIFRPRLQIPQEYPIEQTLRMLCLAAFRLLDDHHAVRNGFVLVSDLNGISFSNVSRSDQQFMLDALQRRLPVRIEALYLVNAPWWIRTVFAVIAPFMKPKLRERIRRIPGEDLTKYLPASSIPTNLGGTLEVGGESVLRELEESLKNVRESDHLV